LGNFQTDLSVCMPLYDPKVLNKTFLERALASISSQSLLPREIVFSSDREILYLKELCEQIHPKISVNILVKEADSASANFNNSILAATSKFVKILCQDDFLINPNHLQRVVSAFENSSALWIASGCRHYEEEIGSYTRRISPRFKSSLLEGKNGIGAPSVVAFVRNSFLPFSTSLHFMYDCEWYLRMAHNFGKPKILSDAEVGIRIHKHQSTNTLIDTLPDEIKITKQLHSSRYRSTLTQCICQKKREP
jgi:glycosyltransferase involved in cell wall biosynthesis